MKRGAPLQPGKGLQRRVPLPRPVPPAPTDPPAPSSRKPRRRTGATADVLAVVDARDGRLCVRCGQPATDRDHVQGRGAGGTRGDASDRINGAAWLRTLCGSGGASGCHGWKEANRDAAERDGYRIARNGPPRDASLVPCLTRHGWVLFTDGGTVVATSAPPEGDARNA